MSGVEMPTVEASKGPYSDDAGTATTSSNALGALSTSTTATTASNALCALWDNNRTATSSNALGPLAVAQRHI